MTQLTIPDISKPYGVGYRIESKQKNRNADYSKIKRKLYSCVLVAIIAAVVFVFLFRELIQQQCVFGDWVVNSLINVFHISDRRALGIYQSTIQGNMEIIIIVAVALCFFLLFRFILSKFVRCFDEVNAGIDSLVQGEGSQIEFCRKWLL